MTDPSHALLRDPFDALFDGLLDAALVVDGASGHFLRANTEAQRLLGYDIGELRVRSPADIHPHELPRLDIFLRDVRRTGAWSADDLSCRRCDGQTVPAVIHASLVRLDGCEAVLIVVRDRREKRLAELGSAVRRLTHDLKNTLATAQLMCDRLAGHSDDRVRLSAESMTRALERAVALCREAVQVGRARMPAPDRERFLLSDLLEELEATVAGRELVGYALVDQSRDAVLIDADFDQTYRIVMNLVRNAFDAGATRIALHGAHDPEAGETRLDITDNGPGLPPGIAAAIGREQAGSAITGSGMGLMIARELCENHGGKLSVQSTGDTGTRFRVTLPAAD